MTDIEQNRPVRDDKSLLIVDDDKPFLQRLARAMESRGFVVETADSVIEKPVPAGRPPMVDETVELALTSIAPDFVKPFGPLIE